MTAPRVSRGAARGADVDLSRADRHRLPMHRLPPAGLALGLRLPGDQDFAAGRNVARGEALGVGSKKFVEARLQY